MSSSTKPEKERPDFIKCIRQPRIQERSVTWCGDQIATQWVFEGVDHVLANALNGGRLLPCEACLKAFFGLLFGDGNAVPNP